MSLVVELSRKHLSALLAEADDRGVARDLVGRTLLYEIIAMWRSERSAADIASELKFAADNVDGDADFEFMRP